MSHTEEFEAIAASVDRLLSRRLPPEEIRRRDEQHIPPYDLVPELAETGLIRAPLPEAVGGVGIPWSVFCRVQERVAYHAFFVASILNRYVCFSAMPLLHFGTEAQQRRLLPGVLDGSTLMALALTEPEAGSDARAVRTRAERVDGGWRIRGRKTWISDADRANYLLTMCRTTEPGGGGGDRPSFTALLVPRHTPGIAMTPLAKVGNNCMPSWDIGYDDVLVSDDDRLGPVGAGFQTIAGTLKYSRASVASGVIGTARAAFDLARKHARERVQFGQPIAAFQVIKHRLVDMHLEITKAALVVRELARAIDAGEPTDDIGAAAKIVATDMLQRVTDHGMQILASAGYAAESPMQRYWRDARLYTFGEGTNEVQREIIARGLGLGGGRRQKAEKQT
jgi:alkylation response protein AidB-like acyl-CoA dehydrogenase